MLVTLFPGAAQGQPQEQTPRFGAVEITASRPNSMPQMRVRFLAGRYELRNATLVDLIRTAWSVGADNIVSGPDWLDVNRFDLIATAPADSTPEALRSMLRELLKERFRLALRASSVDVPAWAITARKPRIEKAESSESSGCTWESAGHPASRGAPVTFVCRNMTVAAFAAALTRNPGASSGYLFEYPVLDRTGLEGAWNFRLTWSPRNIYLRSNGAGEPITLFDAFDKQLGLKLSMSRTPMPVMVVDSAVLPQVPESAHSRLEFEVAEIRPEDPDHPMPGCSSIGVQPGGRVTIHMTLKGLIGEAWGELSPDQITGGKELANTQCWEVVAKAPVEEGAASGWNGPVWNGLDIDSMRQMLRSILIERFKVVAHEKETTRNGYFLLAEKPRLHQAERPARAECREGPGPDGRDPRILNPAASRLVTCRNMTMAQFVVEMNKQLFRSRPLVNMTGLEGRYDMTLNFTPGYMFAAADPDGDAAGVASMPDGAISLSDAFKRQLGLKLEPRKVMAPALVVESANEKPVEN